MKITKQIALEVLSLAIAQLDCVMETDEDLQSIKRAEAKLKQLEASEETTQLSTAQACNEIIACFSKDED